MENAKKTKLPLIIAIGAPVAAVVLFAILVLVLCLTDKKGQDINTYKPPFETYMKESDGEGGIRYYETINNCMTTNFVDVTVNLEGRITKTSKHIKSYDEVADISSEVMDNITTIADERIKQMGYSNYYIDDAEIFYYVKDRKMTPVYMIFFETEDDYDGFIFVNLTTGSEVDYNDLKDLFN